MPDTGWTALIALHATGATLALLLGGYLILRRRKGDLLHRRIGRIWMVDMYWVCFSSFGIQRLSPGHFTWIHGLSLWTILTLSLALRAARRHDVRRHRAWVVGTYLGLVGAGVAAVAFPTRLVPRTAMHAPLPMLAALLGITALAGLVVYAAARLPYVAEIRVSAAGGRRVARGNPDLSGRDGARGDGRRQSFSVFATAKLWRSPSAKCLPTVSANSSTVQVSPAAAKEASSAGAAMTPTLPL